MIRFCFSLGIVLTGLVLSLPANAQEKTFQRQPSVELPAELDRVLRDYESAWKNGEPDKLASLFTEKGYVPSNAGWIMGKKAIREKYKKTGGDLVLRALDYAVGDGVGFIVGAYGYGEQATKKDQGNFILALRQSSEGKWLIVADLDKGNQH